ncbi:TPA: MFS transporter [Klebsiella pneumoniae]
MDSTISVQPGEAPDSLHRARRAAWGSFAGAVVDWYDFLLYGITAALVFNREFFPQIGPAMGTLAAFATFGVGFLFRPLGGIIFGHFGDRLGRKRMLMMTVWMMGIATAFALNYSTQNLGLPRELFLNIGLLVGGLSCLTIPCFAWLADRFGRRRIYITGALIGTLSGFPFFMALESQSVFWILFFALMLANIAHDMVVCVQQPMFTELFGASYRYSGAGVGYQVASVVGGGFTPFIAAALVTFSGGSWHSVALYLTAGCLLSALTALMMKKHPVD